VFENIIEQGAVSQLRDDIISGRNAPSMLFYGPSESGKGSSALELARVLSCEKDATWKCSCPSCQQHRYLQHDDVLALGRRSFSAEITACCHVFLSNVQSQSTMLLFFRSLRKLQLRFSPVLMEDDPKFGKISAVLQSLDERLNEFLTINTEKAEGPALEKLCGAIVKDALALDDEGISANIPVNQIRKAAYWCRLSPVGKQKTLIIENAENMRDEARNSLLKLLEEPPSSVNIVLTAQRREAIMPTILSRLRPYRFLKRSPEGERELLRRVFQAQDKFVEAESPKTEGSLISAYIDSFLPRSAEKLYPLAAWFVVSLARIAAASIKRNRGCIPRFIGLLGERYAPLAETSGLEKQVRSAAVIKTLIAKSGNFENDSFSRFLKLCLDLISSAAREAEAPEFTVYNDIFRKNIGEAVTAVDVLNINTTLALEALVFKLKMAMIKLQGI
jgi:DNA polymerase-3 subunit gamma/tau